MATGAWATSEAFDTIFAMSIHLYQRGHVVRNGGLDVQYESINVCADVQLPGAVAPFNSQLSGHFRVQQPVSSRVVFPCEIAFVRLAETAKLRQSVL